MESYKEIGIEEYKYEAVLDSATSEICRELHGKKFKISEAKPGKNYPPMHPWCRSTTMAVIPEIPEITEEQDNAIEGRLNDEDDLDYEEWCEKHHINPKTGKKVYQGNSKSVKAAQAQATQEQPKAATEPKVETVSEQPKTVVEKPKTAKKSPKSGAATDYSYGHTAEFETTIPIIDTIDTPTVKTTEKIYTDEVAKKVDISGKSGIMKEDNTKPITQITDKAIEQIPEVDIIGHNKTQCEFIQQHMELLKYSRDYNEHKEVAFVFDNTLTSKKIYLGSSNFLDFGDLPQGNNLFVMHNHPHNSSFSTTDLVFMLTHKNVKTISIVKNNGKVEVLTKKGTDFEKVKTDLARLLKKTVKRKTTQEYSKVVNELLTKHSEEGGVFEWKR